MKRKSYITSTGSYLPESILSNEMICEMVDTSDEWIQERCGVKERRILKDKNKATAYMAAEAAKKALQKGGISKDDVEVIIVATATPEHLFPSTPISPSISSLTTECPQACQPNQVVADFSRVAAGSSIEGMGVVGPGLNIDAKGTAVKLLPNTAPTVYYSLLNGTPTNANGLMDAEGGFTDINTQTAIQPHLYTFTFTPGTSVSNFSLHMLDFGDWNPSNNTNHFVSMIAYNSLGNIVSNQELSYITPPDAGPQSSNLYGNPQITGDATAPSGQLGTHHRSVPADAADFPQYD